MQKDETRLAMSLVANYSDSEDSETSDTEPVKTNTNPVDLINDEDDYYNTQGNGAEDFFEEEAEQDVFSIISQLPIAKVKATEATFVDEKEVRELSQSIVFDLFYYL